MLASAFHHASRLRHARAFHPRGVVFRGSWLPESQTRRLEGSPLVATPLTALIRLSHGIGTPSSWPDILGLAIKLVDAHGPGRDQDLLLASTIGGPIGRRLLWPARDFARVTFSTILPYDIVGVEAPIVAHVGPTANTATFAEIVQGGPNAVPLFNVYLGGTRGPRVARLITTGSFPATAGEALRYDPWNTGPELQPVGRLNELRRPTYRASQDGRGAGTEVGEARLRGTVAAAVRTSPNDPRQAS